MLLTVFTLVGLSGCSNNEAPASGNKPENSVVNPTKEPESKVAATAEPISEPEATEEPTPEPTEEPVLYEGIDMESTLPGKEWMETFEGIITEPKLIVFNDETGRKEIIEKGDTVNFNPDVDSLGVYLPEGAEVNADKYIGIVPSSSYKWEYGEIFELNAEMSRKLGKQPAIIYVQFNEEKIGLKFMFIPE